MNSYGSGFIPIIIYAALADVVVPPPGSDFMIIETGLRMKTESGNLMVTE